MRKQPLTGNLCGLFSHFSRLIIFHRNFISLFLFKEFMACQ
ncbi:hypothetical protein BRYFOR_05615 [Marvinbryantia formatexigens DSM 14469]|uniref:Uncharacterized protein n=1 Tax=Marvinbryantia formatexigens DSM 14469 TaxID=478749 RepID=C6LAH3_9FIRM|nr:hypothetical protein BRYFOR_05615 [Marvinbryantia formatexigens DSM 14469]